MKGRSNHQPEVIHKKIPTSSNNNEVNIIKQQLSKGLEGQQNENDKLFSDSVLINKIDQSRRRKNSEETLYLSNLDITHQSSKMTLHKRDMPEELVSYNNIIEYDVNNQKQNQSYLSPKNQKNDSLDESNKINVQRQNSRPKKDSQHYSKNDYNSPQSQHKNSHLRQYNFPLNQNISPLSRFKSPQNVEYSKSSQSESESQNQSGMQRSSINSQNIQNGGDNQTQESYKQSNFSERADNFIKNQKKKKFSKKSRDSFTGLSPSEKALIESMNLSDGRRNSRFSQSSLIGKQIIEDQLKGKKKEQANQFKKSIFNTRKGSDLFNNVRNRSNSKESVKSLSSAKGSTPRRSINDDQIPFSYRGDTSRKNNPGVSKYASNDIRMRLYSEKRNSKQIESESSHSSDDSSLNHSRNIANFKGAFDFEKEILQNSQQENSGGTKSKAYVILRDLLQQQQFDGDGKFNNQDEGFDSHIQMGTNKVDEQILEEYEELSREMELRADHFQIKTYKVQRKNALDHLKDLYIKQNLTYKICKFFIKLQRQFQFIFILNF